MNPISKLSLSVNSVLVFFVFNLALSSCDWVQYHFINSIPFKGKDNHPEDSSREIYVYVGIDGLSYETLLEAQKLGAFPSSQWKSARFISMFPATSDASWSRILHTERLSGYELAYFDPGKNKLVNQGLTGLVKHIIPTLFESLSFEAKYLGAFDFRANGYSHSLEAYRDTYKSLGESMDNFFITLSGRSELNSVFTAYFLEFDVLGHMQKSDEVTQAMLGLHRRIEKFKAKHSDKTFHFTLMSDHGMDFVQVAKENVVHFNPELQKVGINPVEALALQEPGQNIPAVPVHHTRVSYLSLHTLPEHTEEVALRASRIPSVDLAVSKIANPFNRPEPGAMVSNLKSAMDEGEGVSKSIPKSIEWFGIWSDGQLALIFGFDPSVDRYFLPVGGHYDRLDLDLSFEEDEKFKSLTDEEAFKLTMHRNYPDLFYRVRTGLNESSCLIPAEVILSVRLGSVAVGFQILGGATEISNNGFHGSLHRKGSTGTLLTDERIAADSSQAGSPQILAPAGPWGDLPTVVRSETVLDLFPRLKEYLKTSKGLSLVPGDPNESLDYGKI